jgi:hypothetical protein
MVNKHKYRIDYWICIGIGIVILILLLKNNIIFCETLISQEDLLVEFKNQIYNRLVRLIKQEDFINHYKHHNSIWISHKFIINEQIIKHFIENISWLTFIKENQHLDSNQLLSKICEIFLNYIDKLLQDHYHQIYIAKEKVYTNTINSCNMLIKQQFSILVNHINVFAVLIVSSIILNNILINDVSSLITSIMDLHNLYPHLHPLQILADIYPHIVPTNVIEKAGIEQHILTPQAQIEVAETIADLVSSHNTKIFLMGVIIIGSIGFAYLFG